MEEPGLTSSHANTADVLLSQEVPDLDQRASLLDDHVDGEMGVHRAHLVPEAHCDTLDHVLDVTAAGADRGQLLSVSPPFIHTKLLVLLSKEAELQVDVVEVPAECAPGSFDNDRPALQLNLDIVGNVDSLVTDNGLHSRRWWRKVCGDSYPRGVWVIG